MRTLKMAVMAAALGGVVAAPAAFGQGKYPEKPVTIIVPYGAGTTDTFTRRIAAALKDKLGQTFVVENKTGAFGNVGTGVIARSAPDGYTLGFASATVTINQHVYKLDYDVIKDFTPIAKLAEFYMVLTVNRELPANSVKEFFEYAKKQPKPMHFGFGGLTAKIALARLASVTGATFEPIPYKGGGDLTAAVMAGQVPAMMGLVTDLQGQVDHKTLKPLGVTSTVRLAQLPNVPTIADTFPGYEQKFWFGYVAPAGTPRPIVDLMNKTMHTVVNEEPQRGQFEKIALVILPPSDPDTFAKYLREELASYGRIVKQYNITAD